jgi:multidrug transporter EmrE-like cation transporter
MLALLKSPIFILVCSQLFFTTSDILARAKMRGSQFELTTFVSWWFLFYTVIRQLATFGQLYVFCSTPVGKALGMFGAASIVLANLLGLLFLKEVLTIQAYIGITLAISAFVVLSLGK